MGGESGEHPSGGGTTFGCRGERECGCFRSERDSTVIESGKFNFNF